VNIVAYTVAHGNSTRVLPHLARAVKAKIVPLPADKAIELRDGGMMTYGEERGLRFMLDRVIAEKRDWVYIDNGYFKWGHFAGYYRVTHNRYMVDGTERGSERRWRRLGLTIKPWRKGGSFVLVCPPPARFAHLRKFDEKTWLTNVLATLKANTDREIKVREKPSKREIRVCPIEKALAGAHALVCHSSNAAAEALIEGYPVFCTDPCSSSILAESDVSKIESPRYPDGREAWAQALAANQWTIGEMKDGTCWREIMQ
jgi:hypothetical protein